MGHFFVQKGITIDSTQKNTPKHVGTINSYEIIIYALEKILDVSININK